MQPQSPQFNNVKKISPSVSVGPKGSFGPTTKGDSLTRTTEPWTKKNAEIMAQRKNSVDGKTAKPGPGTAGRPKPFQGVSVPQGEGKPPKVIGGPKGAMLRGGISGGLGGIGGLSMGDQIK